MCLVLDLGQFTSFGGGSVSFMEAADDLTNFTEINVSPQVFLCLIIGQMVPNYKTPHIYFFAFSGNFIIRFSGNKFS